jgi:hypothetical protein
MDRGQELFTQIKGSLIESSGVVAIEVESGDYFTGATLGEANDAARHRYLDHWLYFVRLDNPEATIPLPVW